MAEQVVEQENSAHRPSESGSGSGFFGGLISGLIGSSAVPSENRKVDGKREGGEEDSSLAVEAALSSNRMMEDRNGSSISNVSAEPRGPDSKGDGAGSGR